MNNCPFCEKLKTIKPILENDLAISFYDEFPVNPGHMLFITKRHVETFFDTTNEEKKAIFELVDKAKAIIDKKFKPDGYNIGLNCGFYAGQTVMHIHLHLIPRYKGDIENPKGGIRAVIPSKKEYNSNLLEK